MKIVTFAFILPLCVMAATEQKTCEFASDKLYQDQSKLSELHSLLKDLERRFQEYTVEDFSAQVDGVANELHRNKAIKVAFAKRRLNRLIDSLVTELSTSVKIYCDRCKRRINDDNLRSEYCGNCPTSCPKPKNTQ